jgi:CHAT domain-containing protein/Tfp pilus assembly protein PilF
MVAPAKDDRTRSEKGRVFISHRAVLVVMFGAGWLAVALALGLIVRGNTAERGMAALVTAYRDRRPIEARLSGGFEAGVFDASADLDADRSDAKDNAGELLREAAADSGSGYAQLAYGRLLLTEGSTAQALRALSRAVEMMPSSAQARNDLGVCFMERQEPERAIEEFDQALALDPAMPEGWFNRSLCYERLLLVDAARSGFTKLESLEGNERWLREVRQRIDQTSHSMTPLQRQGEIIAAFDQAFDTGDLDEAKRIVAQNLEVMTRHVWVGPVVVDYLRLVAKDETESPERLLRKIEFIGRVFFEARADTAVTDVGIYLSQLSSTETSSELALFEEFQRAQQITGPVEAKPIFERLGREFSARGNKVYELICAHHEASCDYSLGNMNAAAAKFEKAIALTEQHRWPYRRAHSALMLGLIYSRLGKDSQGIKHCNEALHFFKGLAHSEAKALQILSLAYFRMGDYDNRLDYLRRSTRMYLTNIPNSQDLGSNYSDMAAVYALRGEHELALHYARQAQRFCSQASDYLRLAQSFAFSAVELGRLGQFKPAEQELQQAFDQLQKISLDGRSYTESQVFRRAGELALAKGEADKALEYYSKAEEGAKKSEDQALSLINVLRGSAEAHARSGDAERARKDLVEGIDLLSKYRVSITERSSKSDFLDANYALVDQLVELEAGTRGQLSDAFDVLEESRARALQDELKPALNGNRSALLSLDKIVGELPDDLTMIVYAVTSQKTYIFVITSSEWRCETSTATTGLLDRRVHEYVAGLKSMAPIDELKKKGSQLYQYLIRPVEALLKKGNGLCIVPDKALHFLPFGALVDGSNNYVIESHRLTYSPSASVLIRCIEEARRRPARSSETMLAVGNPKFNKANFPNLGDLPEAEQEAVTSALPYADPTTLLGPQATKQRVLSSIQACDVLHLAAHCLVEERSPWLAALVLADQNQAADESGRRSAPERVDSPGDSIPRGTELNQKIWSGVAQESSRNAPARGQAPNDPNLLYLDEVYKLTLPRTRLVVLSACQSGLGQYYRGEGIVSLVRPFLALGVPTVVASLWSVHSKPTASLMIRFHDLRRTHKLETSEALRAAQIGMAKSDLLSHPIYWAPFITVGFDR